MLWRWRKPYRPLRVGIAYSVSFDTPEGRSPAEANIGGEVLSSGQTAGLPAGIYPLNAVLGAGTTFLAWIPNGAITAENSCEPFH